MKSLVPVIAILVFAIAPQCNAELILDNGFELASSLAPDGPWIRFGVALPDSAAPGIDPTVEGSQTLQVLGDSAAVTFSGVFQDIAVDGINIGVSNEVELSGIAGHLGIDPIAGSNEAYLEVSFVDLLGAEFGQFRSSSIDANSATDQYFSLRTVSAVVPSNATEVRVKAVFVQPGTDVGAAWFDNLSLAVAVPEPSSALLFSVAAIFGLSRRRD